MDDFLEKKEGSDHKQIMNLFDQLGQPHTKMAQRNECAGLLKESIEQHLSALGLQQNWHRLMDF